MIEKDKPNKKKITKSTIVTTMITGPHSYEGIFSYGVGLR